MGPTTRSYNPAIDFPLIIKLACGGSLAASSSVVLDSFPVGPAVWSNSLDVLLKSRGISGAYLRVEAVHVNLQSIGTSNSAGNVTWQIKSLNQSGVLQGSGPGAVQATSNFAYNASVLTADVDLRDNFGKGVPILANDTLQLLVTAVPTTTGNAPIGINVHLFCKCYGVRG